MGTLKNFFQNINFPARSNWKAIILSIVAASVFWLFQSLNKNYSTNLNYPIEFDFPRERYIIMSELPDEVQINISSIGWNIFRKTFSFGLNPIRIHLENPAATTKIVGASLLANINDQLPQFQVNYIISDTLHFNIQPKASRAFRIVADSLSIDLETGYRITSPIEISPDSVIISGPKAIIEQLPVALPIIINQENIDEPYEELIEIKVRGYQQSLLSPSPENVDVSFAVEEFVTRSGKVKLRNDTTVSNIYAIDSMVNVTYTLPASVETVISESQIEVAGLPKTLNIQDSTIQLAIVNYPDEIVEISLDSTSAYLKVIYE